MYRSYYDQPNYSDHRYEGRRAGERHEKMFNEERMVLTIELCAETVQPDDLKVLDPDAWQLYEDGSEDAPEFLYIEVPCRFEVCSTCSGKGRHVNPSIDDNGISREQFAEDPDFAQDYFSGVYDVDCYECRGKRVVPEVLRDGEGSKNLALTDRQRLAIKLWDRALEREAEYQRICDWERRMGC